MSEQQSNDVLGEGGELTVHRTVCRKCGKSTGENRQKYCGDGSDKDNGHDWQQSPITPAEASKRLYDYERKLFDADIEIGVLKHRLEALASTAGRDVLAELERLRGVEGERDEARAMVGRLTCSTRPPTPEEIKAGLRLAPLAKEVLARAEAGAAELERLRAMTPEATP